MGKLLPIVPPSKGASKEEMDAYFKAVAERWKYQERMAAHISFAFGLFFAMIIVFIVLLFKSV